MVDDERDGIRLTSLDAPLGDGLQVTKGDLVDHLDAFADRLVPLLAGRPLSVKRVRPGQQPFMQRNVAKGAPDWVRTVPVWSQGAHREVHQVLCDDRRTLLWLANQRAVEFHVPFVPAGAEEPTGIVLDLDPPEGAGFEVVVRAAELVRQALADAGLAGAVKTSGSKGVHVVVPVRGVRADDAAAATRALAVRAERLDPDLATTAYIKADRHDRVFLDSTRSYSSTIVAAYSPRVRPGLPVSAPVSWADLPAMRPGDVTIRTAGERLGNGDPWAALLPDPQELPADLVAEGHTIPVARVQAMHEGRRRARARREEEGD
ncbi:DNA polymerase domain-containing protein [Geodermatophilus sabuli]|uniref:DNA ligase D, polymerase domain-containing protein n=1 Tax=Geodermatophilus sabuli TaxID=1564158 RepID=A0A285E819_9ACTN|nr:ATP-dependent DNA ligase [Geodermatophilus sabuli]MBB3082780.1 DNA ligase D-like protein (predicted polymerase) [Geodermatophilus sabuli]SNX94354.1 DNA ligase D, polymerase domain-containing protein [Geodermatophilus sabuli]